MVISRASADAPRTFRGQTASYYKLADFPTGQDTEFQVKKITIPTYQEMTPVMYAEKKIELKRTGTSQAGLQDYTRP